MGPLMYGGFRESGVDLRSGKGDNKGRENVRVHW